MKISEAIKIKYRFLALLAVPFADVIDDTFEPTYYIGTGRVQSNVKIGRNINVIFRCKPDYAIINDIMAVKDMRRIWDFIIKLNNILNDNKVYVCTGLNGAEIYIAKANPFLQGRMETKIYDGIKMRLSEHFTLDDAITLLDNEFDYDMSKFDNSVIEIIEEVLND